jgi:hypothetical protein
MSNYSMRLRTLLTPLALCAIGLIPESAHACRCAVAGSPCGATWQADAAFVGQVVSIESSSTAGGRLVRGADVFGTGRFVFTLVEGGKHDIHVSRGDQISIVPFTAVAGSAVLKVVMKPRPH